MSCVIAVFLMYLLHLLLKITWPVTVGLMLFSCLMIPVHKKRSKTIRDQQARFEEACLYMDSLLYAFLKSGKIESALGDVAATLAEGRLKETVQDAYEHLRMTFDEEKVMEDALKRIEQVYPCKRLQDIHAFLLHVEYYGGEIGQPVRLLLEDKANWERRTKEAMRERKKMWTDIVLSVAVSLIICGIVMYLPVMNVDISGNPLTQILTVIVIGLDEMILLKGQKYLGADWLTIDQTRGGEAYEKKMQAFLNYDVRREKRRSVFLCSLSAILACVLFFRCGEWIGAAGTAFAILCANQHRVGYALEKKTLIKGIRCEFPVWLMDLVLLLQSENVQVALRKSAAHVPAIFRTQLNELIGRLEISPESSEPYHRFLDGFDLPEIRSTMSMLYALSIGNNSHAQQQIAELIARNQRMLDHAQKERLKDQNSGMYLLFLAPVLTASLKLITDMAIFMLSFLSVAAV